MASDKVVTLTIPRGDLVQIIEGLEVLSEQWEATALFYQTGEADEDAVIRECSGEREASLIHRDYKRLIRKLWAALA